MSAQKPIISDDPFVQAHYEKCLREGTSPRLAEMFATGQTPYLQTDAVFLAGNASGSQFEKRPELGDYYAKVARKHGQMVKGKKYLSSLARFPGDPEAWVDGRGDVERVIRKRKWNCEGAVKVNAIEQQPPVPDHVADDIVAEEVHSHLEDHPEPRSVDVPALAESIRRKRMGGTKKED